MLPGALTTAGLMADWAASMQSFRQVVDSVRMRRVRSRSTTAAAHDSTQRGASSMGRPFWKMKPPPSKMSPSLAPTLLAYARVHWLSPERVASISRRVPMTPMR